MKELSIEEKAKRYDEALKYAKIYYTSGDEDMKMMMKTCFPVLVEDSEDERIMKALIDRFKRYDDGSLFNGCLVREILAWIEKQSEQNLVKHFCDCVYVGCHINDCKRWCHSYQKEISYTACNSNCNRYSKLVNHAFNIGETITDGISAFKIADIKGNHYIADDGERVEIYMAHRYYTTIQNLEEQKPSDKVEPKFNVGDFLVSDYCMGKVVELTNDAYLLDTEQGIPFSCEHNAHIWTIKDAKDGDVLFIGIDGSTCIFKKVEGNLLYSYIISDRKLLVENSHYYYETSDNVYPATKEQRDLLFQKMREAGYEWDADKKELKKIEQKPAWSEEDELMLNDIITCNERHGYLTVENINWLKSLKDRVQPKQEWSKEDENNILFLTSIIEECFKDKEKITLCGDTVCANFTKEDVIDRLKSLRPQNTWRPSDEQMKCISDVVADAKYKNGISTNGYEPYTHLSTLLQQLKKLREE